MRKFIGPNFVPLCVGRILLATEKKRTMYLLYGRGVEKFTYRIYSNSSKGDNLFRDLFSQNICQFLRK